MTSSLKNRLDRLESWQEEQFDAARAIMAGGRLPLLQQALICKEILCECTAARNDLEETAAVAADVERIRAQIESGKSDPEFEQDCREFLQALIDDINEMNAERRRQMVLENQQRGMMPP